MAMHRQTGRACEEQCIPNHHALIEKNIREKKQKKNMEQTKVEKRIINNKIDE